MRKWRDDPTTLPTTLAPDWASLNALLDTLDARDVPCRATGLATFWTSDDPDDQRTAAAACAPCPAIEQCRAYGLAHPTERGVYGGMTETERGYRR